MAGTGYGAMSRPVDPVRDDREVSDRNPAGAAVDLNDGVSTAAGMAVEGAEGPRSSAHVDVPMGSTEAQASVPVRGDLTGDGVVEPRASTEIGAQRSAAAAGLANSIADVGAPGTDDRREMMIVERDILRRVLLVLSFRVLEERDSLDKGTGQSG